MGLYVCSILPISDLYNSSGTMTVTREGSLVYLMEKLVLLVCTSALLLQIYLSLETFQEHDYVEIHVEEKLYNVDQPMIIVCAEDPFTDHEYSTNFNFGLDANMNKFVGWAKDNKTSTYDSIVSKIWAKNSSDLVNNAFSSKDLTLDLIAGSKFLQFEILRILSVDGQCFSLNITKDDLKRKISDSNAFIVALTFNTNTTRKIYLHDPNMYNGYYNLEKAIELHGGQIFDVVLAQTEQSPEDPRVSCESYDNTLGYYDCVTKAAEDTFVGIMGCVPPWFSDNEELVCQNEDIDYVNNKLKVNMSIYTNKLIGLSALVNFCCLYKYNVLYIWHCLVR